MVDRFTPHSPPIEWYALGDSYTASPGTGADFDPDPQCRRNNGSYAIQLENDFPFEEMNDMGFIACSGFTATDVMLKNVPLIQQDRADFMVMTLGGNDIGFSGIATDCLIRPGLVYGRSCEESLSKAERDIADSKLENNIHAVYDAIFQKMKDDYHYQLYHVFYSRFFNDETEWCDRVTFSSPITGPRLKRVRRQRINQLVDLLNSRLEGIASNYIQKKVGRPSWSQGSRLITINPDKFPVAPNSTETYGLFDGHRFCEPDHVELENPNVWFFGTLDPDSPANNLTGVQKRGPDQSVDAADTNELQTRQLPEWVIQSFHPKTAGMKAVKWAIQVSLQEDRPAER